MADAEARFLGYESSDLSEAYFSLIPAPHDATASYIRGQALAPQKILDASSIIDDYDEETGLSLIDMIGIHALAPESAPTEPGQLEPWVKERVAEALAATAVPVILGGDGTVSLWGITALLANSPELTVLHIDANADLGDVDDEDGSENHHTVMRRVLELEHPPSICQVGIRTLSRDSFERIMDSSISVETFFMADVDRSPDESWQDSVIDELRSPVYLSIDMTGLDPSVAPAVGAPEPGGLRWWQLLRLLKKVASRRRIAAIDITELCPTENSIQSELAAARLIYKTMNYIQANGKMLSKP
ncbi:MAG: arginase family protein [Planctomycetota bacterium]|jgi:agmatinase|nr:arginase family protein [Planctomycetota bacterium]